MNVLELIEAQAGELEQIKALLPPGDRLGLHLGYVATELRLQVTKQREMSE